MNCPVCAIPLTLAERQGVEIDYCPQCRGVWLDRGELDKIIDRSAGLTSPGTPPPGGGPRPREERPPVEWRGDRDREQRPPYREPDDHRRHDYEHGRRKKREGWLGELFDFD
ncbi:MAG: zf-TFIIB domain-containing protein [Armatimonadota bacterium]